MPGGTWTAFGAAAKRHHGDAEFLARAGRHGNADHLAGVAAECALKAILLAFLQGTLNAQGRPVHPSVANSIGHLPHLWEQIALAATGRTGSQFLALVAGPNPFASWEVSERYSDAAHIAADRAAGHISSAAHVIALYEQASITGVPL